jgi:ABC-type glutathione transport system ATPase component
VSILTAAQLAKSYGPDDIFAGVDVAIPQGARIGLVGPNGAGKTTLLRLLAGLEEPSRGVVHVARGVRLGYLQQEAALYSEGTLWEEMLSAFSGLREREAELARLEAAMADPATYAEVVERYGPLQHQFELDGGYAYETRIRQVLGGLNFGPEDFARPVAILSGGQKTRALLARLLLESPDLLILDEPTNHLDIHAVEWLEGWLNEWDGAVLCVSHDRYFLDQVVGTIWEMEFGRVEEYRGNYSAYLIQRADRRARQASEFGSQQQHIAKEQDFIRRNMAGQNTRQAQGRLKRLERLLAERDPHRHRQQSQILVPRDAAGVVVRRGMEVFGYDDRNHGGHAEIEFHDVRVPASNLIGEEGDGFAIAQARLGPGRIHHCMRSIGVAERAIELMCDRASDRVAFGKPLAEQGVIRDWIAESRVRVEQLRLLVLKTAWLMDTVGNKGAHTEIQAIKIATPKTVEWILDKAIQVHGAGGLSQDFPLAEAFAGIRTLRFADGPDEVHKNALARNELKRRAAARKS